MLKYFSYIISFNPFSSFEAGSSTPILKSTNQDSESLDDLSETSMSSGNYTQICLTPKFFFFNLKYFVCTFTYVRILLQGIRHWCFSKTLWPLWSLLHDFNLWPILCSSIHVAITMHIGSRWYLSFVYHFSNLASVQFSIVQCKAHQEVWIVRC